MLFTHQPSHVLQVSHGVSFLAAFYVIFVVTVSSLLAVVIGRYYQRLPDSKAEEKEDGLVRFVSFASTVTRSLSRNMPHSMSNTVRHKSGDWENAAAAAVLALEGEDKEKQAKEEAEGKEDKEVEVDGIGDEPQRTRFYLSQGLRIASPLTFLIFQALSDTFLFKGPSSLVVARLPVPLAPDNTELPLQSRALPGVVLPPAILDPLIGGLSEKYDPDTVNPMTKPTVACWGAESLHLLNPAELDIDATIADRVLSQDSDNDVTAFDHEASSTVFPMQVKVLLTVTSQPSNSEIQKTIQSTGGFMAAWSPAGHSLFEPLEPLFQE